MRKAEVGHGARSGSYIEGIARGDEDDVDGLDFYRQETIVVWGRWVAAIDWSRQLCGRQKGQAMVKLIGIQITLGMETCLSSRCAFGKED
jgi:hypothetical protein